MVHFVYSLAYEGLQLNGSTGRFQQREQSVTNLMRASPQDRPRRVNGLPRGNGKAHRNLAPASRCFWTRMMERREQHLIAHQPMEMI